MQALQSNNVLVADMSHYQGDAQFTGFAAYGVHAAIFKSSQGTTYVDPMFATFTVRARAEGVPFTLYHYAQPNKNSAADEAQHFIKQWQGAGVTDGMYGWLDIEDSCTGMTADQVADWVLAFETAFKSATGRVLGLYSDLGFIQQFGGFNGRLSHMPLWIADYPAAGTDKAQFIIQDIGGWTDWVMWQFEDNGTITGVPAQIDMSYARSLEAIGYVAPKPLIAPLSTNEVNYIVNRWIGREYDLAGPDDQLNRAYLADRLRMASGDSPHNAPKIQEAIQAGWKPQF